MSYVESNEIRPNACAGQLTAARGEMGRTTIRSRSQVKLAPQVHVVALPFWSRVRACGAAHLVVGSTRMSLSQQSSILTAR